MRSRNIKPGIMSNEDIAELGPYAYILFTGLWMIADREGRLEHRPKKIKALCMPLWDEVSWEAVENLVQKLCERHLLQLYRVGDVPYIQVSKWRQHQNPDPREAQSRLPAPPPVNGAPATTCDSTVELQCVDSVITTSSRVDSGLLIPDSCIVDDAQNGAARSSSAAVENPTTTKKTIPMPPPRVQRKQPAREERVSQEVPQREARSARDRPRQIAHTREDVDLVRASLQELAKVTNMPAPDDGIVYRVLNEAPGASASEIHEALCALWKRNRFRAMYSWGFVPLVISQVFKAA